MSRWCPSSGIRFKALGLHWRDGRLLAAEVRDDAGRVKGVRPLGGTVEFGESAECAVVREFQEELGITVVAVSPPTFMENIFLHEGNIGHEVVAIFDVSFPPDAFGSETRIQFTESCGTTCHAEWFSLDALDLPEGLRLYPAGLKAHLVAKGGTITSAR